jgi:hypothetical protein
MSDKQTIGGIYIPANSLTPDEMQAFIIAYIASGAPYRAFKAFYDAMARPGVTFTPEQEAQIRAMVEVGKTTDAQRAILDHLKSEFGD